MPTRAKRLRADREQELRGQLDVKSDDVQSLLGVDDVRSLFAEIDYLREQNQAAQVYATQLKQRIKGLGG